MAMVGNSQTIECRVDTTVRGVSSITISWTGPEGPIMNSTRVTISPTTSIGNIFTSSLQFAYLIEGDEGNYTCNWIILQNSSSRSLEIQSLVGKLLHFVSCT